MSSFIDSAQLLTASTTYGQCSASTASLQQSLNYLLSASHSLMAAHSDDSMVCTDDLQALFDLAEVLHGKKEWNYAAEV